jgi:mRNA-degrading endonuclease toxin of MazEF toxin-antitoxin module
MKRQTGDPRSAGNRGSSTYIPNVGDLIWLSLPVQGVILSDHLKSADWQERHAEYIGTASPDVLHRVRERLKPLLGM